MVWRHTLSGKAFELSDPQASLVDFKHDVAPMLAKLARFNGATRGDAYTVAQHCVLGADWIFRKTGDKREAALFLLHDAHEAYLGDITTPAAQALDEVSPVAGGVRNAIRRMKAKLDRVIYEAAGIAPPTTEEAERVHVADLRMMLAERNALMAPCAREWDFEHIEAADIYAHLFEPWSAGVAAIAYRGAFIDYLGPLS